MIEHISEALAVLDRIETFMAEDGYHATYQEQLRKACAAFAELIRADHAYDAACRKWSTNYGSSEEHAKVEICRIAREAALAAVDKLP